MPRPSEGERRERGSVVRPPSGRERTAAEPASLRRLDRAAASIGSGRPGARAHVLRRTFAGRAMRRASKRAIEDPLRALLPAANDRGMTQKDGRTEREQTDDSLEAERA